MPGSLLDAAAQDIFSGANSYDPINDNSFDYGLFDTQNAEEEIKRLEAADLKKKELFRKGKLEYEDNGELLNDSNAVIRAKEAANALSSGADWLLEASENAIDFGQGKWLNNAKFDANVEGKKVSMDNKDIIGARDTTLADMIAEYKTAENNPNADKGIYTLRKFDGYNPDGSEKYLYKYGLSEAGAFQRYDDQGILKQNQLDVDGWEIVDEKRFVGAKDWEAKWNALPEVIRNRTFDKGYVKTDEGFQRRDAASGIDFGSGYTEVLNKDLLGNDIDKTDEDYAKALALSQAKAEAYRERPHGSNPIDALQAGLSGSLGALGDFAVNKLTPYNSEWLAKWTDQDKIDKSVGYDRVQSQQDLEEAYGQFAKGNMIDGSVALIKAAPGLAAESLGYMIPDIIAAFVTDGGSLLASGVKDTSAAISWANRINKAEKLGNAAQAEKLLNQANKVLNKKGIQKLNAYKALPNTVANAKYQIGTWFPKLAPLTTIEADQILNERVQHKIEAGEDPTLSPGEIAAVWLASVPIAATEHLAFYDVFKGGPLKNIIKDSLKIMDKNQVTKLAENVIGGAAKLAASSGEEAAQEYIQTWGELIGSNYGIDKKGLGDIFTDAANQKEAVMGALGGLGAGGLMHAAGVIPATVNGYNKFKHSKTSEGQSLSATSIDDLNNKDILPYHAEEVLGMNLASPKSENKTIDDFNVDDASSFNKAIDTLSKKRMKYFEDNDVDVEKAGGKSLIKKQVISNVISHALKLAALNGNQTNTTDVIENTINNIKKIIDNKDIDYTMDDFKAGIADDIGVNISDFLSEAGNKTDEEIKADLDKYINQINGYQETIRRIQGSEANVGGKTVEIDDTIPESSGLRLEDIKNTLLAYRNNEKTLDDVAKEFSNLGFLREEKIYDTNREPGSGAQTFVNWKPSIRHFATNLKKTFTSPQALKNSLKETAALSNRSSLAKFVEFAQSRREKMESFVNKKKQIVPKQYSRVLIETIKNENDQMQKLIYQLKSLLSVAGSENKKIDLTDDERNKIREQLNTAETELKKSQEYANKYLRALRSFVEKELGVKFKSNEDFLKSDKYTTGYEMKVELDKDGNQVITPVKNFKKKYWDSPEGKNKRIDSLNNLGLLKSSTKHKTNNKNSNKKNSNKKTKKEQYLDNITKLRKRLNKNNFKTQEDESNARKQFSKAFKDIAKLFGKNIASKLIRDIDLGNDTSWFLKELNKSPKNIKNYAQSKDVLTDYGKELDAQYSVNTTKKNVEQTKSTSTQKEHKPKVKYQQSKEDFNYAQTQDIITSYKNDLEALNGLHQDAELTRIKNESKTVVSEPKNEQNNIPRKPVSAEPAKQALSMVENEAFIEEDLAVMVASKDYDVWDTMSTNTLNKIIGYNISDILDRINMIKEGC